MNQDELKESMLKNGDIAVETGEAPQDFIDVYEILGNPYKTSIGLPSLAELKRVNWKALIFAVVWWFICFYIDCVVQVTTEHIENNTYPMSEESDFHGRHHFFSESYELFDLGFFILSPMPSIIADVCAFGLVGITILRFLVTRNRFIILKRYMMILGTIFLFRALTIVSTILPQPQRSCMSTARGNPFLDGLLIILLQKKTCTDMFFSGHATNMTLAALIWTYFSHTSPIIPLSPLDKFIFRRKRLMDNYGKLKRPTVTKIFIWLLVAVGCYFVSATRLHYMIDIIFGLFVTITVFKLYHHALAMAYFKETWFSKFVRWFDSDSPEIEIGKRMIELYPFLKPDSKVGRARKNSVDGSESDEEIPTDRTGSIDTVA